MKERSRIRIIGQVALSTAISAAIVLVILVIYSWWNAAARYYPEWERETFWEIFRNCLFLLSLNVYLQLAVVFVASLALALLRRKHNMLAGSLAGLAIILLDLVLPLNLLGLQSQVAQICVWLGAIPLLATALQFIRKPRSKKASSQTLEAISAKDKLA